MAYSTPEPLYCTFLSGIPYCRIFHNCFHWLRRVIRGCTTESARHSPPWSPRREQSCRNVTEEAFRVPLIQATGSLCLIALGRGFTGRDMSHRRKEGMVIPRDKDSIRWNNRKEVGRGARVGRQTPCNSTERGYHTRSFVTPSTCFPLTPRPRYPRNASPTQCYMYASTEEFTSRYPTDCPAFLHPRRLRAAYASPHLACLQA